MRPTTFPEPNRLKTSARQQFNRAAPIWIALAYLVFGGLWILLSDNWAQGVSQEADQLMQLQQAKGLLFVLLSGLLIFFSSGFFFHRSQQASERMMRQYRLNEELTARLPMVMFIYDIDANGFTFISSAYERLFQERSQQLNRSAWHWLHKINRPQRLIFLRLIRHFLSQPSPLSHEVQANVKGHNLWLSLHLYPVFEQERMTRFIGVIEDVSQRHAQQTQIERMTQQDVLTQLPNRNALKQYLQLLCQQDQSFLLLFLDLDQFKNVNESLGHSAGDRLIRKIADRLVHKFGQRCWLGRIGGDEFAMIFQEPGPSRELAEEVLACVKCPLPMQGMASFISGSLGLSHFPEDGQDVSTLMRKADIALYAAKANGRHTWQSYSEQLSRPTIEQLRLEAQLHQASDRQEFCLYYQPKYDLRHGQVIGAEALIRWQHPSEGLLSPGAFIQQLEELRLIEQVGFWVLEEGITQLARWQQQGLLHYRLAVNLSAKQLQQDDLVEQIEGLLLKHQVVASNLEIELTESALLQDPQVAEVRIRAMQELGIRIALDDFGTGYSSLSYLQRFSPDVLKIDRSFVKNMTQQRQAYVIVENSIRLAHDLHMTVVAEGVETHAQLRQLKQMQCDAMQGYLGSVPVSAQAWAEGDFLQDLNELAAIDEVQAALEIDPLP